MKSTGRWYRPRLPSRVSKKNGKECKLLNRNLRRPITGSRDRDGDAEVFLTDGRAQFFSAINPERR